VQFLGAQLGSGQALDFARDMLGAGLQHARGLVDWQQLVAASNAPRANCGWWSASNGPGAKLRWLGPSPEGIDPDAWQRRSTTCSTRSSWRPTRWTPSAKSRPTSCACTSGRASSATRTARFAIALRGRFGALGRRGFAAAADRIAARHRRGHAQARAEDRRRVEAESTEIARQEPMAEDGGRAWVFTSATLGDEPTLRWFTEPCGLRRCEVLRVQSPFDYASQAALYVPRAFPKPNDPGAQPAGRANWPRMAPPSWAAARWC
jgi:ATP-dependent DNA helicase DinG